MTMRSTAAIAAPLPAAQPTDAALVALGSRWEAVIAEWNSAGSEADHESDAIGRRESAVFDEIMAVPAVGLSGLAVKARVMARAMDCTDNTLAGVTAAAAADPHNVERSALGLAADVLRLDQKMSGRDLILSALVLAEGGRGCGRDADLLAMRDAWLAARTEIDAHTLKRSPADEAVADAELAALPIATDAIDGEDLARIIRIRNEAIDRLPPCPPETEEERKSREDRLTQACRREDDVIDAIAAVPARTLAGVAFKVEVHQATCDCLYQGLIDAIMADIASLAAGA